jgi:hypothetical protein
MSNRIISMFKKQSQSNSTKPQKTKAPSKWKIAMLERSLQSHLKRYSQFMKENNAIAINATESSAVKKRLNHALHMDKFDMEYAKRYTQAKLNEQAKKAKKKKGDKQDPIHPQFGDDKVKAYKFQEALFETIIECCRVNNWITRKDWIEHGVPMNKIFADFYKASVLYAEVRMYYKKQDCDRRQREYSVIKQ